MPNDVGDLRPRQPLLADRPREAAHHPLPMVLQGVRRRQTGEIGGLRRGKR